MSYFLNAAAFLIQTIFSFAIGLFLVRVLLLAAGASFYEPVCRFVYSLTNPVITPLRRFVPRWGRIELASLLVAYLLALIELGLFVVIGGAAISAGGLLMRALIQTLDWLVWIELIAIFVRCILSFVVSEYHNSSMQLLVQCTERCAPVPAPDSAAGRHGFSCWFASIALILAQMLVLAPLADFAANLTPGTSPRGKLDNEETLSCAGNVAPTPSGGGFAMRTHHKIAVAVTVIIVLLLALLIPRTGHADQTATFGDVVVRYSAISTDQLFPAVAQSYGIERSNRNGLVNIAVEKKGSTDAGEMIAAVVTGLPT
jgi:YggT family protein